MTEPLHSKLRRTKRHAAASNPTWTLCGIPNATHLTTSITAAVDCEPCVALLALHAVARASAQSEDT